MPRGEGNNAKKRNYLYFPFLGYKVKSKRIGWLIKNPTSAGSSTSPLNHIALYPVGKLIARTSKPTGGKEGLE